MRDDRHRLANELDKNFMVEAAAGTGKTTSMVTRMLNLLAEGKCQPSQLAAVTFTRKAAAELRERFQQVLTTTLQQLATATHTADQTRYQRLRSAEDSLNQTFIGTIHSFCAMLIRQRPIEFSVHPGFRELQAEEALLLRERAWQENLAELTAADSPLLTQLKSFGLETSQLKDCFHNFVEYRDIQDWPSEPTPAFDLASCQNQVRQYVDQIRSLTPHFPSQRNTDKLMGRYELIVRSSARGFQSEAHFFRLLELFDHSDGTVQKDWHDKNVAKRERDRFTDFRQAIVKPALSYWRQRRYQCVVQIVRAALAVYQKIKQLDGALDFTDLLLTTAAGLREQPHLRAYFQARFTHLLVDEFQDTDPIQAEAVVLLSSADCHEREWQRCSLRPGALFVVGDPKQSIYRFRRGDIATYNRVKSVIVASGGELLSLSENYRSSAALLEWNNQVFATKFPTVANEFAPAHTSMQCGRPRAVAGELSGLYQLPVEKDSHAEEAEQIARFIRHAIATGKTIERWSRANNGFELRPVQANDFLIITRVRQRLGIYKAALTRHGVECEVSGSSSFIDHPQLQLLLDVLRAADDPYNPVHYLSLLRERLFGFSDAELYALKEAQGSFVFTAPIPSQIPPELRARFVDCSQQMNQFQGWLRSLPPLVALERIADQLGLLAESASQSNGNGALGSLLKAFELLRTQSLDFDNTSDLIEGLERLLEIEEADSINALGGNEQCVRLMNLHKAKGLEAPIVFLADTKPLMNHLPSVHIDRQEQSSRGAMGISMIKKLYNRPQVIPIAEPVGWSQYQAREQQFLDAEADRLLYVATTRAANMLVVSRGGDHAPWSDLHAALSGAPQLPIPTDGQLQALGPLRSLPSLAEEDDWEPTRAWQAAQQPSYTIINVKKEALRGSKRPDWQAAEEYGMVWGIALHELLEIASRSTDVDLRPYAAQIASEYDIATDRGAELVETVQAVILSDIWQRSRLAPRCYSELPFELLETRGDQPTIIRGVIDLIFEEADGWVIIDYKSDSIDIADIDSLCDYYRPQLADYARYWHSLTGHIVKEQGLYLTRHRKYERLV